MSVAAQNAFPTLRPLQTSDLDAVLEIEQSVYPYPWSRGIFADCLRVGYACTALLLGQQLVGYAIINWGGGEAHLLNLCVARSAQHCGHGRLLLRHVISQASRLDCQSLFLEVRPSNERAVSLYRRESFETVGRRRDYYPSEEGREDALTMRLALGA